jgi:hypothetical protein
MSARELDEGSGLVVIDQKDALSYFTTQDALDPILAMIRKKIDEFVSDATTAKGRKEIASVAYSVSQSSAYLDKVGKALVDDLKEIPKKVDASRKHVRDILASWRDEVRAPLDAWEEAEEKRVNLHVASIGQLNGWAQRAPDVGATKLRDLLEFAEAYEIGPHLDEFEAEYARAKDGAIRTLRAATVARERFDAEQAELKALRQQAAERAAMDRDEAIRREATEKAQREAGARAQAERETRERAEREAARRAELREIELRLQVEKIEQRAADAAAQVAAIADAREAAETAAREAREANREHKAKVNSAAVAAFAAGGLSHAEAIKAVVMIARKAVPNVHIAY